MFTRYAILSCVGPEVTYIHHILLSSNEFLNKTAKSISLHKRRVNQFHHCFKPQRIYCVLNSKYIIYINASISRVSICRKKPLLKILRVLQTDWLSEWCSDWCSLGTRKLFDAWNLKIAQNDVELATFWLFYRNGYEILALCNRVLSV